MGFIKKKKSGKVVVKIPRNRAHSLSEGNYVGIIKDYQLKTEAIRDTEYEVLILLLDIEETSIKRRVFINFEQDCPFTQLLDVLEVENDQYIDFDDFLGVKIGFHLKEKNGYLNISKVFRPEDIDTFGVQKLNSNW